MSFLVDKLEAEKQWKHVKHTHPYPTGLRFDYKGDKDLLNSFREENESIVLHETGH